jgi:hypothetical protein
MTREARTLLALVRDAQDPTPADEARVLLALRAKLAAGAAASAAPGAGGRSSAARAGMPGARPSLRGSDAGATLGSVSSKWLLMGALAASLATGDTPSAVPVVASRSQHRGAEAAALPAPPEPQAVASHAPERPAPVPRAADAAPVERQTAALDERAGPRARRASRADPQRGLRAELELLERVQAALRRGDARAALRALDAHRTDDRVLLAERRAARILALCGLGRTAEAQAAAAEFERQHPDSVQRAAIASSCANSRWIGARRGVIGHETQ